MIVVGIYIKDDLGNYNKIELFADENISVNSSIQNINDISKTFTDFSQTFTVPAAKQNNKIFKHWYENSNDNGFSTLIKSDAYIELDTIPFKSGKIQLESCNIKNGKPQDYSITFIGALGNLKDTFAGLLLKDLNTGEFDFSYSDASVRTKVTTQTTDNVKFPLISSLNAWTYAGISTVGGTINASELFPALRLRKVLELIENKFNITFEGYFIDTDSRFLNAYLLLKNADLFKFQSDLLIDFANQTIPTSSPSFGKANPFSTFDFTTETLKIQNATGYNPGDVNVNFNIQFTVDFKPFYLLIYKNGVFYYKIKSITRTSPVSILGVLYFNDEDYLNWPSEYTFKIESEEILTFYNTSLNVSFNDSITNFTYQTNYNQTSTQTTTSVLKVASYMPEQKIEDFFSGILKMFNLTCYSTTDGIYNIEPLEDYYNNGNIVNITKHIKSDNVSLNRTKTYDKINFKYEKSENILSVNHLSDNRLSYGDLLADFDSDGSDYEIKLPFEHLKFASLNSNLTAGFIIKTDLKPYIPKPIILYDYGTLQTVPQFYLNETTTTTLNTFGAETLISGDVYALNFGIEQSVLNNNILNNSLYSEYYQAYLTNIFNFKARLIKVSAILPISLLTSLKLNDRLIIRDKRYLINTMQTNLITGEVQFELLTDNRIL